jgi:hypothetical protein
LPLRKMSATRMLGAISPRRGAVAAMSSPPAGLRAPAAARRHSRLAAQTSITPMALDAFLQTPHHRMPDLHLSRAEIDDVSAYILSLRAPAKH